MSDITTLWSGTHGDWSQASAQLQTGNDLATAVVLSLFTDREASSDDTPSDGTADPRGWWGDDGKYLIGSRLWLIERSKRTQETLTLAQSYIEEALQWLIDDGVVAAFDVFVEWTQPHMLGARITAFRNDGTTQALNYSWVWNGIN